jgi:hypothetical protein
MIDFTAGAARELIAPEDVESLRTAGALVPNSRLERSHFFDGKFLAARDLIRDQQYFLAREADLGQAAGGGVTVGLRVAPGAAADELVVSRGHGVTPAGELTLLPRNVTVRLADIPLAEQLSARFGLSRRPQPPVRNRTGLFVLALRPVEFTANPIGAYPTSITGQRTVEDGDVIEATAVVLVPWTDDNAADALDARRGRAARAVFVENRPSGVSANVLPLAMVALQNNIVAWLDVAMVRRELGADFADRPGLDVGGRALRLAHVLQYAGHLDEEVRHNGGRGFPAVPRFGALPPAGPMPPGMIATRDFTQNFFPAEVDAELSAVPEDELPVMVDEALGLPPIDLTVPPALLESTAVLVLAPVPRAEWVAVNNRLNQTGTAPATRQLLPAAANRLAARKPLQILQRLRIPAPLPVPIDTSNPVEQEWARLAALPNLWFVRRRSLAYRDDLAGRFVRFAGRDVSAEDRVRTRLAPVGLGPQFDALVERAPPNVAAEVSALLESPRFATSPVLTAAALGELTRMRQLDRASVLATSARLTAPGAGDGLLRLERSQGEVLKSPEALTKIAATADWRETDAAARSASETAVPTLAAALAGRPKVTRSTTAPAPPRAPAAPAPREEPSPRKVPAPKRRPSSKRNDVTIKPIDQPLPGEQVVALSPETAAEAAIVWLARPNLFPGRALTAPTLQRRQRWQAGRLAVRGQTLTAGVVQGLEVGHEVVPRGEGEPPLVRLTIAAGAGLATSGEDVVLARPVEIELRELPVFAEPSVEAGLPPGPVPAPPPPEDVPPPPGDRTGVAGPSTLRARAFLRRRLGALLAASPDAIARVGVLVLQPVEVDRLGEFDPTDPCELGFGEVGDNSAFEDWPIPDGVRLAW